MSTMTQEENLQVVDEHTGEPTGICLPRSEVIKNKHWCRSTNVFVMNEKGEILCHQRSKNKERHPGVWSTHFGGHVSESETFKINALKELEEEIGLSVSHYQLIPWRTSRIEIARIWVRDFMTVYAGDLESLKPQAEEIDQIQWFSPEAIIDELQSEGDYDESKNWLAGTHNFDADYQCMRAVLTAVLDANLFSRDHYYHLHKWKPMHSQHDGKQ